MMARCTTQPRAPRAGQFLFAAALLLVPVSSLQAEAAGTEGVATLPAAYLPDPGTTDVERARELEARAWSLRDQMNRRSQAGRLLRQAAELRPADDPAKVSNLRDASRMSFHAGDFVQAATDAGEAARAALRQGDVLQAAHAYLDAAWMAAEAGDPARALASAEEAMILTASPLLSSEDREGIMGRVTAGT